MKCHSCYCHVQFVTERLSQNHFRNTLKSVKKMQTKREKLLIHQNKETKTWQNFFQLFQRKLRSLQLENHSQHGRRNTWNLLGQSNKPGASVKILEREVYHLHQPRQGLQFMRSAHIVREILDQKLLIDILNGARNKSLEFPNHLLASQQRKDWKHELR